VRIDLSAAFIAAKNAATRSPRQLLVFNFPGAGVVRLSDQPLGAVDGLADEYPAFVEDWGTLVDMAGGDPTDYTAGEIRQASIVLWNGGTRPFSDYFLGEDPENVTVELYQWFAGLADSDKVLIDTFTAQDPIAFDEASRLLSLDLVSLSMRHDNPVGELVTKENWPNAYDNAIGTGIPLVFGTPGEIPTTYARTAPETALNGSILDTSMTINVSGDLTALGFSASGSIQIGEELIRYSSRTTTSFTVLQRGYLSAAAEHLDRDKVVQKIEDHTFLVSKGPIYSIGAVKVGGFAAPAEIFASYPALNPARVVFTEKPYSYRFSESSDFLEMQFDLTNADNTALQAYLAYDAADQATAATISPLNPLLSIQQTTANPDRGEIVKAYLAVEHWESAGFLSDYVEVWVEGVGIVGNLSRPNQADAVDVVASVDIDHGHSKSITGEHTHLFTNPNYNINDPTHGHVTSTTTDRSYFPSPGAGAVSAPYGSVGYANFYFPIQSIPLSFLNAKVTISVSMSFANMGVFLKWGKTDGGYTETPFASSGLLEANGTYLFGSGPSSNPHPEYNYGLIVMVQASGLAYGASAYVGGIELTLTQNSTITPALTGTSAALQTGGSSALKSANDISVNNLAVPDVPVTVTDTEAATRTIVNLFDLTSYVNFDWAWFTGRDVKLSYRGTVDAKEVFIAHCFFDVEYRKRERVFSDEVTCEPVGLIDDGSGTYTGTPGAVITRPDHVRKYLLCNSGGMPTAYIDTASFATAGSSFAALGYTFNGLLDASLTVRDAEKKLAWQCRSRFFWNAGKAKIALRRKLIDTTGCKLLGPADYRLKSISAQRQRVMDLVNSITLFYSRQWTSTDAGTAGFVESVAGVNNSSIDQHGTKEKRDLFTFDLVTSSTMANDLLAFYLENLAYPSTFYTFDTYIGQFELEKEDCISLTSTFNRLRKANMVIRAADRAFGSGKLRRINYIRIVAESLRYIMLEQTMADTATMFDSLTVTIGLPGFFNDSIFLTDDQVFALIVIGAVETITVNEALAIIFQMRETVSEAVTASDAKAYPEPSIAFGLGGFGVSGFGGMIRQDVSCRVGVVLGDSITVFDILAEPSISVGFGSGGFGQSNFGGTHQSQESRADEAFMAEIMAAFMGTALSDTATVADSAILFSAGFGGNTISDGFGVSPFGR